MSSKTETSSLEKLFQQGLSAQSAGRVEEAKNIYAQLISSARHYPSYVNLSVILREAGHTDKARTVILEAISFYPSKPHLWHILAKTEIDAKEPVSAYRSILQAITLKPKSIEARLTLVSILCSLEYYTLALRSLQRILGISILTSDQRYRYLLSYVEIMCGLSEKSGLEIYKQKYNSLIDKLANLRLESLEPLYRLKALSFVIQHFLVKDNIKNSLKYMESFEGAMLSNDKELTSKDTEDLSKVYHTMCWNLGIVLIKKGDFISGWKYYEHGLQVPAAPPQRWQRALKKLFTPHQVPIWRGENLENKSLIVLAEQAVGDTMMFLRLISLVNLPKTSTIALYLPSRLAPIYKRSFPEYQIYTHDNPEVLTKEYSYQIPCGSLPSLLLTEPSDCSKIRHYLSADKDQTGAFREKYSRDNKRKLIGISWRGGGVAKRIPLKSSSLEFFLPIMIKTDYQFVSLQYGKVEEEIEKFNEEHGTDIIYDNSVNSLVDMDTWLSQVAAMDAVLTVANTTVHGSAGLGIPTCVLVSDNSDWRWLDHTVSEKCLWYDSVCTVHQRGSGSWSIDEVNKKVTEILDINKSPKY